MKKKKVNLCFRSEEQNWGAALSVDCSFNKSMLTSLTLATVAFILPSCKQMAHG
jgi:hypothetical protein